MPFACALVSHSVQSNPWTETPPDTAIYRTSWHNVSGTYNVLTRSCFASVQINSVCAVRTPECVWVISTIHDWKTCHCSPNHWCSSAQKARYQYTHLPHFWRNLTGNLSDLIVTDQSWHNLLGPMEIITDTLLLLDWPSSREIPYSTGPRKRRYIRLAPVRGDWQRFLISEQFEELVT